ncbi:MAG: hypothetical protein MUF15_09960 [Acidobacteria bacterium]|nr:hypothetical protein [Acidobacteriota bacterium]
MTQLLKQAFNEAARLPEMEQNVIARWLLLELASEKRWMETFADSEDLLSDLADEAFVTHQRTGKCAVRGAI